MPNLIINTVCNLQCPYCFAEDCKTNNKNQEMTYSNFCRIVDFVCKGFPFWDADANGNPIEGTYHGQYIGVLGGEPTIHSQFDKFMCKLISNDAVQNITVFTNGLEIDKHIGIFSSRKIGVLVNFNDDTITSGKTQKVIDNVRMLINLRKEHVATGITESFMTEAVNLGLNLYDENQDFTQIIGALKEFNMHHLRLSVVVPNSVDKKNVNPIEYFEKMKPALMRLCKELYMIDAAPHLDCNYVPRCIFTDDEIKMLDKWFEPIAKRYNVQYNLTTSTYCQDGPLDIYPDGTVARCFGYSEYDRQDIKNYENIDDIRKYFRRTIEDPSFMCVSSAKCKDCYNHKSKLCSGGCLSYKTEKIKKIIEFGESLC